MHETMPLEQETATAKMLDIARGVPIAILGYDSSTPDVVRAAIAFGFIPVLLHAPNGTIAPGSKVTIARDEIEAMTARPVPAFVGDSVSIDVVGEEEFGRAIGEQDIPLVIGAYGLRERDYFRENLLFARNKLKYQGRILHPCFLADFHRNPNRRFAIIGLPGSGNMIFQNICSKLLPAPSVPVWASDPLSAAISQFALSYWYSLGGFIASAFDDCGRCKDVTAPTHMRSGAIHIYVSVRDGMVPAVVAGLPQRSYVWSNPWHTSHEPLTEMTAEFFNQQNFHIVQILRHPLDLVVSNAAKITSAAGDRAPQLLLQNDGWMDSMLQAVEAYYKGIAEQQGSNAVSFFKYEELLASPVPIIRKLAEILQVECDDTQAEQVWSALEGKPLSGPGHLWDPRADKWTEYISPRFAERIMQSRLPEYAAAVGYRLQAEDFKGSRAEVPPQKCDLLYVAWQDACWEASIGKRPMMHPDVYQVRDKETGLLMICGREFEEPMERLRQSPVFHDMLSAARQAPWGEPPLVAEFLGLRLDAGRSGYKV